MKKIVSMFIIIVTILSLVGCGSKESKPEALAGDHKTFATLDDLKTTKQSAFYLSRGNNMYLLGRILEGTADRSVGISISSDQLRDLYSETDSLVELNGEEGLVSLSNYPIPIIHEGDKIYLWNGLVHNRVVSVKPIKLVGFHPQILNQARGIHVGTEQNNPNKINQINGAFNSLKIYKTDNNHDEIGEPMSFKESLKLDYGQKVNVYWKEVDTGKNHIMYGENVCSYYEYSSSKEIELPIIEKDTNKDYTVFDPTKLEKGYYAVCIFGEAWSVIVVQ